MNFFSQKNRILLKELIKTDFKLRYRRLKTYGYRKNRAFHTFVFTSLILTKFMYKED